MRLLALCCAILAFTCQTSYAGLIVTLTQVTPGGAIILGDEAVFQLTIHSDTGSPISNVAGIDVVLNANDPLLSSTETSGGQFIAGSSNIFPNVMNPFLIPFPTSVALFGANNGSGITIGTSPVPLATLTLSTAGATPGTYLLGMTGLTAVEPGFVPIDISGSLGVSYTITTVPEPASMFMVGALAVGFGVRRLRRGFAVSSPVA